MIKIDEIDRIRLFLLVGKYLLDAREITKFWVSVSDETLIEATEYLDTDVNLAAVNILKERNGGKVELALIKAADDTNSDIRQAAVLALQERQMNEWDNEALIKAVKDHNNSRWTLTIAAVNTLKKRRISESDAKAIIEIANSGGDYTGQAAADILLRTRRGEIAIRKELRLE